MAVGDALGAPVEFDPPEQIAGLQDIHEEELRRRDAALRMYKEELQKDLQNKRLQANGEGK